MEIIISFCIAYIFLGFSHAMKALNVSFYERSMLANKNPFAFTILYILIWPIARAMNNYDGRSQKGRAVAFGLMAFLLDIIWVTAFAWACLFLAVRWFDEFYISVPLAIGMMWGSASFVSPIATIVIAPVMFAFAFLIDLVFPLKE